jgi:hypothetical protein
MSPDGSSAKTIVSHFKGKVSKHMLTHYPSLPTTYVVPRYVSQPFWGGGGDSRCLQKYKAHDSVLGR